MFLLSLALILSAYVLTAEGVKRRFYARVDRQVR
jgi:hypothetical protein